MRTAVAQNGWALQHAAPELKSDREFMLTAVAQNGWALQYAAPELQGDREFMLTAVAQNGNALSSPLSRAGRTQTSSWQRCGLRA